MPKHGGRGNFSFGSIPEKGTGKKVSENNGQLRFRPPPQVEHASCLDQYVDISYTVL